MNKNLNFIYYLKQIEEHNDIHPIVVDLIKIRKIAITEIFYLNNNQSFFSKNCINRYFIQMNELIVI